MKYHNQYLDKQKIYKLKEDLLNKNLEDIYKYQYKNISQKNKSIQINSLKINKSIISMNNKTKEPNKSTDFLLPLSKRLTLSNIIKQDSFNYTPRTAINPEKLYIKEIQSDTKRKNLYKTILKENIYHTKQINHMNDLQNKVKIPLNMKQIVQKKEREIINNGNSIVCYKDSPYNNKWIHYMLNKTYGRSLKLNGFLHGCPMYNISKSVKHLKIIKYNKNMSKSNEKDKDKRYNNNSNSSRFCSQRKPKKTMYRNKTDLWLNDIQNKKNKYFNLSNVDVENNIIYNPYWYYVRMRELGTTNKQREDIKFNNFFDN